MPLPKKKTRSAGSTLKERFVVGIGASAGGLEAIRDLVEHLSPKIDATYVVAQHMAPQHRSVLAQLIGRDTELTVVDAEDGAVPEPGTVYITPPNRDILFENGCLRLVSPSDDVATPKPSVDRFFASLAENAGERAVGIVLSGTGNDGAYGIQTIRVAGGITIAQREASAKYDGMPLAAVESGCVDLVLTPQDIAKHLARILSQPRDLDQFRTQDLQQSPTSDLLQILLARTRVDFREYKATSVTRRIERRMAALGIGDIKSYTTFCRANPGEVDALFRDLLISVTRFFRDQDDFFILRDHMNALVREKGAGGLRIWVAGCATGEEVYSIAILLAEALGGPEALASREVQIFATDIDRDALAKARQGQYPLAALNDVPAPYRERYFVRRETSVQVRKELREIVRFSEHNICQDPPFLNIDLVCCRNVLIYFGLALQKKVLSRLHFALGDDALLFLGSAETVAGSDDLFWPLSHKSPLFRRRDTGPRRIAKSGRYVGFSHGVRRALPPLPASGEDKSLQMFEGLARAVGPNALLVTNDLRIQKVFGNVSPYISMVETNKLALTLSMLRRPLDQEARMLVSVAVKNQEAREGLEQDLPGEQGARVRMAAYPVLAGRDGEGLALLTFQKIEAPLEAPDKGRSMESLSAAEVAAYVRKLEGEISATRDSLRHSVEQLETTNEALQSLNEELQATNEELQATNEELETSNEELQSTNEELVTVNEELQVNATQLAALSDELVSVLENVGTSVLVVDSALQINHASRDAEAMFGLEPPVERPHLSQCRPPAGFPDLPSICNEVLQLGTTIKKRFTAAKAEHVLSCAPYADNKGRLAGVAMVVMPTS